MSDDASEHEHSPATAAAREHIEQARQRADMGTTLPDDARAKALKAGLLRVFELITTRQIEFNNEVVKALSAALDAGEHRSRQADDRQAAALDRVAARLDAIERRLTELSRERDAEAARLTGEIAHHWEEFLAHRRRVDRFLESASGTADTGGAPAPAVAEAADHKLDSFFAAFADRFRGDPELIRKRLETHLPLVMPLAGGPAPVLDIGSGRGEWLELLRASGVPAYGVDTNADVVDACRQAGLDARCEDGLAHLQSLDDGALGAVTLFHVVEHVPLATLIQLIDAALGALAPGGLLLMETPNPLNLTVGAAGFWLDPSHERPIHPELLHFATLQRGFSEAQVIPLHPDTEGAVARSGDLADHVNEMLHGPQDYAVAAWKAPGRSGQTEA